MIRKKLAARISALLVCLVSAIWAQPPQAASARLLVGFRPGTPGSQAEAVIQNLQGRTVKTIPQIGVHVVELPANANPDAVSNAFKNRPEVEFVEPDTLLPPATLTPNDPAYANWQWALPKVNAPAAWSTTTGSGNVVIAIIDTGVDGTHPDLSVKMVPGWNIYSNNSDTSDVYGHGTTVAGTAAAISNNGIGVASMCWQCPIMPIRVSDTTGYATFSNLASGVTWAADHGAKVANMSYQASVSSTVTSAAQYFMSKGGVVTASAGNGGTFVSTAANAYILTVGATDPNDALYIWSDTGNFIDLVAPGCVFTTTNGGGYSSGCGTSYSAPMTAGAAALLLSAYPSLTPSSVMSYLKQSAVDLGAAGWDTSFGYGRLNIGQAMTLAGGGTSGGGTPPTVSLLTPASGTTISATVSTEASATASNGIASVTLAVDGSTLCTVTATPYACNWNTASSSNGGHTVAATARDTLGNSSTATASVTVSNTADTTPPTIAIKSPANGATVSKNVSITTSSSDNVGVVAVDLYIDNVKTATSTSAPFSFSWNTTKAARGTHTLRVVARDAAGNTGSSPLVTVTK